MKGTELLHNDGQSLWLDNLTLDMQDGGTLQQYGNEGSITGDREKVLAQFADAAELSQP